jgi:hypothetical protein
VQGVIVLQPTKVDERITQAFFLVRKHRQKYNNAQLERDGSGESRSAADVCNDSSEPKPGGSASAPFSRLRESSMSRMRGESYQAKPAIHDFLRV